jgi:hypothetical protein
VSSAENVFLNCPFDDAYKPSFEAVLFTIKASGYKVQCALEDNNTGAVRFDKLCRLIRECAKSVHDLSRTDLSAAGMPRFNMPFELGLYLGAGRFGSKVQQRKTALVMVTEPYRLPVYLSDLAGNDPQAHHGRVEDVTRIVRKCLHQRPDGTPLPGAARILAEFVRFNAALPVLAKELQLQPDEVDPFHDYRVYMDILSEFLRQA